jgi:hypothetical protein
MKPILGTTAQAWALVCILSGCASDDTILVLNVDAKGEIGLIERLSVTVTQQGSAPFDLSFTPPTKPVADASPVLDEDFFRRITLPDGFERGIATVELEGSNEAGKRFTESAEVLIHPGEATAVFVELQGEEMAMPAPPPSEEAEDSEDGEDAGSAEGADVEESAR